MSEPATLPLPSVEHLLLSQHLYAPLLIKEDKAGKNLMNRLKYTDIQLDCFCTDCKMPSTFKADRGQPFYRPANHADALKHEDFCVELLCQRYGHVYRFYFTFYFTFQDGAAFDQDKFLVKVGQYPSMEDIAASDIEKFRSVLGKQYFSELHRATGLASHGIGIGSFVYLRRIFERLITTHYEKFVAGGGVIKSFETLRMDEKVQALASVLPPALVKHKVAYGILSKGLHELDEDTCKRYFPVIRAAIMRILEDDLQAAERLRAEKDLELEMQRISSELGTSKTGNTEPARE